MCCCVCCKITSGWILLFWRKSEKWVLKTCFTHCVSQVCGILNCFLLLSDTVYRDKSIDVTFISLYLEKVLEIVQKPSLSLKISVDYYFCLILSRKLFCYSFWPVKYDFVFGFVLTSVQADNLRKIRKISFKNLFLRVFYKYELYSIVFCCCRILFIKNN